VFRYLRDTAVSPLPSSLDQIALPRLARPRLHIVQFFARSAPASLFVHTLLNPTTIFPVSHRCKDCDIFRLIAKPLMIMSNSACYGPSLAIFSREFQCPSLLACHVSSTGAWRSRSCSTTSLRVDSMGYADPSSQMNLNVSAPHSLSIRVLHSRGGLELPQHGPSSFSLNATPKFC